MTVAAQLAHPWGSLLMVAVGTAMWWLSGDYRRRAVALGRRDGDADNYWERTGAVHRYFIGPLARALVLFGVLLFLWRLIT